MAYQRRGQHDQSLICDTVEDLKKLPRCNMGSSCYVIETAESYMANSEGIWVRQTVSTNNGGSGDSTVIPDWLIETVEALDNSNTWVDLP